MPMDQCKRSTIESCGFKLLSTAHSGLEIDSYWHPAKRVELMTLDLRGAYLLKGMKRYAVVGQSKKGRETYERDLPELIRYMEDHFPEAHLYLSFFRDIPVELVPGFGKITTDENLLQANSERFQELKSSLASRDRLLSLFKKLDDFDDASDLLRRAAGKGKNEATLLRSKLDRLKEKLAGSHEMIRAYQETGRATLLAFGYSSPLFVTSANDLEKTVDAVLADIMNTHHKSIRQKLEGGQLQIYIEELRHPGIMYSAEAVGLFSPTQLNKLAREIGNEGADELWAEVASMLTVFPSEDIQVPGYRTNAKRFGAKVLQSFLKKVEVIPSPVRMDPVPDNGIWIGNLVSQGSMSDVPYLLPLDRLNNAYCSGASGSGKSFLSRVMAEGAIAEGVRVVVIDPGNQWASLVLPEDRPDILDRYAEFGMDTATARGFPSMHHAITKSSEPLPASIHSLDRTNHIFSLKALSKPEACKFAARLLDALFQSHAVSESEHLRTLVIIDEAHRLTSRRSDEKSERQLIFQAEEAIDLIGREGRKYGLNVMVVSQTIRDFSHAVATLRQNTNTKIFLRNSDLEIDYAKGYLADADRLPKLRLGEAFVYNADLGEAQVFVRPPFSKVIELSEKALHQATGRSHASARLTSDEESLLRVVREHVDTTGDFIQSGKAMASIGISSVRRQQHLIENLERRHLIRTERSSAPGNPRLIIPLDG